MHEANFQKHLLGLDSTGSLFQNCIKYIERLEKQLAEYNSRKRFGKLRCNAVEDEKYCENIAVKRVFYKGDPQIYKKEDIQRLFLLFYVKSITKR